MSTLNLPFLKALSEAAGVPGREERVREIIRRESHGIFDEVSVDPLGSLIGIKKSKAPSAKRVLLACHIDEIGFYVRHIDDKGYLRIHNAGGFDTKNLQARRVLVQSSSGGGLIGLLQPNRRAVHICQEEEKEKIPAISRLILDPF